MNLKTYNDIDILLVHKSIDLHSCSVAINCKKSIKARIQNSDIVMLSINEEKELSFIKKSKALLIGYIRINYMKKDVKYILNKILKQHKLSKEIILMKPEK